MIIAARTLKLRLSLSDIDVPVSIYAPEQLDDGSWRCRYEIGWPDKLHRSNSAGVDSAQALILALQMIGSEIHATNYHKEGILYLDKKGDGYGFPVPPTLRGLLVGDDRKYL